MKRAVVLVALAAAGCPERTKVGSAKRDGGSSVVVVERTPERPGLRDVPLDPEREPDDDAARAQPIAAGRGVRATLRGDEDWFRVDVGGDRRQALRVDLDGAPGVRVVVEAIDGATRKAVATVAGGDGEAAVIANLAVEAGQTWLVRVRPTGEPRAATDPDHPYRIVARLGPLGDGDEVEPNDKPALAGALGAGASGLHGAPRDEDWLRVVGDGGVPPDGGTLRIELSAVDGVAATVRVADGDGMAIVEAKGRKGGEVRLRNAPAGTFVVVRAESGANPDVRWSLHAGVEEGIAGSEIEPNGSTRSATPVEAGVVRGYLWPGDVDVYKIVIGEARRLRAEMVPPDGVDGRLELLAPEGRRRAKVDEAGRGKPEVLTASLPPGTHFVSVAARPGDTAFDSPYQLTISLEPEGAPPPP